MDPSASVPNYLPIWGDGGKPTKAPRKSIRHRPTKSVSRPTATPPATKFVDVLGKLFDATIPYDLKLLRIAQPGRPVRTVAAARANRPRIKYTASKPAIVRHTWAAKVRSSIESNRATQQAVGFDDAPRSDQSADGRIGRHARRHPEHADRDLHQRPAILQVRQAANPRYDAWFLTIHSSTPTIENPIMIGTDSQR